MGWQVSENPLVTELRKGEDYHVDGRLLCEGSGPWVGRVDFGDGGGEQELIVRPDGTFRLEHVYRKAGRYSAGHNPR